MKMTVQFHSKGVPVMFIMAVNFHQWPSTLDMIDIIPRKTWIYESIFRWCWSWWIKWARLAASPRRTWSNGMVNVKVYRTTIYHWFQEHSAQNCWNWSNQTNFTWSNSPCSYQYKNSHEYDHTGISSRSYKNGRSAWTGPTNWTVPHCETHSLLRWNRSSFLGRLLSMWPFNLVVRPSTLTHGLFIIVQNYEL